MLMQVTPF